MKRRTYPAQRSGKSPYQKHGKRAFQYSENYYRWKSAMLNRAVRYGDK